MFGDRRRRFKVRPVGWYLVLGLAASACSGEQSIQGRSTSQWIERLYSSERRIHLEAHQVLNKMVPASRADVRVLLLALRDTNPETRDVILSALSNGAFHAQARIREALTDDDSIVRAGARVAISRLPSQAQRSDTVTRPQSGKRFDE